VEGREGGAESTEENFTTETLEYTVRNPEKLKKEPLA
jgi:hypothetical protein